MHHFCKLLFVTLVSCQSLAVSDQAPVKAATFVVDPSEPPKRDHSDAHDMKTMEGAVTFPGSGPRMVAMPGGYFIDSTEVTRSQYQAWLNTNPPIAGQPKECAWNDSYEPASDVTCPTWPPEPQTEDFPVVCVDWCDAYAYCQGVGKRLCGKIGGGENAFDDYADAMKSQWYAACSSGGKHIYAYGDTYEIEACNGEWIFGGDAPVGSMNGCQSKSAGYAGVYDMSGNVWEWEDSCNGKTGYSDYCHFRGGSFNHPILRCDHTMYVDRNFQLSFTGFRCCSSP